MSISDLAPPPLFLPAQGRPPVPLPQWFRMFETFLLDSRASDIPPEPLEAILLQSRGIEGQRIFFTLPSQIFETAHPVYTATEPDEAKKLVTAPSSCDQPSLR
ncbi:hypothetical protein MTO96_040810 [Rhipicephalus appendiculatus]